VASYTYDLEEGLKNGKCYNEPVTIGNIENYIDSLAKLFPSADWTAAKLNARQRYIAKHGDENGSEMFQSISLEIVNAVIDAIPEKLTCPQPKLQEIYGINCLQ